MLRNRVLVVEDDPGTRFAIRDFLSSHGYEVSESEGCAQAEGLFNASRPDVVLSDYSLPDGTALDLLPRLKEAAPLVPVIVLTAHGSIELAVRAIKEGAEQFLTKPVELSTLLIVLDRTCEHLRNRQRQMARHSRESQTAVDPFYAGGPAIRRLQDVVQRVAAADSPVLIQGETGTGKSVLAAWIHRHSPRGEETFVDLNCAALSRELLETELFGHQKGAFTGAVASKVGLLEVAHHGTLFLDEIGDVDPNVQPKLLKVVEEKRFRRLGDVRDRTVDVRLIAATHSDLSARVKEGKFREDLYFRISTVPIRVPSLRERPEDIPALGQRMLERLASQTGRVGLSLAPDAWAALQTYPWPGNIRELRNVLERAILLTEAKIIT
ncbi:MAG TPA: sigma-54 dependent transcriptional regulator, partial [Candidatus Polarisedimenticolia bacterium]|nr:sigma-54 dependent transcriptional regulator [Candidatus Polarisedimenticolia bacterium]